MHCLKYVNHSNSLVLFCCLYNKITKTVWQEIQRYLQYVIEISKRSYAEDPLRYYKFSSLINLFQHLFAQISNHSNYLIRQFWQRPYGIIFKCFFPQLISSDDSLKTPKNEQLAEFLSFPDLIENINVFWVQINIQYIYSDILHLMQIILMLLFCLYTL